MVLREREILSGAEGREFKVYISVVLSMLNKVRNPKCIYISGAVNDK